MAVRRVRKRFCKDQLEVRIRSFCAMRDVVAFTLMSSLALIVGGVTGDVFRIFFRGVFGGVFGGPSEPLLMTKPLGQPLAGHQSQAHLSSDNDRMTLFFFLLFFERELCGTLLSLSFFGRELCGTLLSSSFLDGNCVGHCGFQWNSHLLPNLDTSGDLLHWIYKESLHTASLLSGAFQ